MKERIFELERLDKTTITVDMETRVLIKNWARRHNCTMAEAVWLMAGRTLAEEAGLDFTKSPFFERMKPQTGNSS